MCVCVCCCDKVTKPFSSHKNYDRKWESQVKLLQSNKEKTDKWCRPSTGLQIRKHFHATFYRSFFLSFTLEDLLEFRCWYFVDLFTNSIGVLVINVSNIRYSSNPEASVLSWPKLYGKSNAKVQAKSPWRLCTVAIAFLHCCIIFFCLIVVQPEPENVNLEFFRCLCCEITAKDSYEKTSSSRCVDLKDTMHSE